MTQHNYTSTTTTSRKYENYFISGKYEKAQILVFSKFSMGNYLISQINLFGRFAFHNVISFLLVRKATVNHFFQNISFILRFICLWFHSKFHSLGFILIGPYYPLRMDDWIKLTYSMLSTEFILTPN